MNAPGARVVSGSESSGSPSPKPLGLDYEGHNLVFVVGSPRSGTTWLQRLLASHPAIRTGQESNIFFHYVGFQLRNWRGEKDEVRGGLGLSCYFTEEQFHTNLKMYLHTLLEPMVASLGPGELFIEKSPAHAMYLPEIFELLPKARVIHILRDARDVASSLLASDKWLSSWAPRDAAGAASVWTNTIKALRDALPNIPPEQFYQVRYEDLSRSPVTILRGCADFLGLEWQHSDISRAVEENQARKARATGGGTAIPLYGEAAKRSGAVVVEPKGFIRKAQPGSWKDDLSLYQKFWVWRVAHRVMDETGYDWPKAMELAFACGSACADLAKRTLSPKRNRKQ